MKKDDIIALSLAEPWLSPTEIRKRVGAGKTYTGEIRKLIGAKMDRPLIRQIIQASRDNPTWGCKRIARLFGCSDSYVRRIRRDHNLKLNYVASVSVPAPDQSGLQGLSP